MDRHTEIDTGKHCFRKMYYGIEESLFLKNNGLSQCFGGKEINDTIKPRYKEMTFEQITKILTVRLILLQIFTRNVQQL